MTIVVADTSEAQQYLALYAKFWLDGRSTGYWTGAEPIPWYLDVGGPAGEAAARTRADYLAGGRVCTPAARRPSRSREGTRPGAKPR